MAAPTYTTDLTQLTDGESGTWVELASPWNIGDQPDNTETDYFIQGSACASSDLNGKTGLASGMFDNGTDLSGSFTTGETVVLIWHVLLPANAMSSYANDGLRAVVAGTTSTFSWWTVGGSDYGRNPYGGWQNYAVDPGSTPTGTVGGGHAGTYRYFGAATDVTAVIRKGTMHGWDAQYYGRAEARFYLGEVANPGVFSGMAAVNDAQSARWGIFQAEGTGYLWKGLMSFSDGTNACYFKDANVNITVEDTPATYAGFNRIEINHADSIVDWSNVNITTLNASGLSKGEFEMVDNAETNLSNCVFTDMSTFVFQSSATVTDSTFRRCGLVDQVDAVIDGCIFDNSTAATSLSTSDLDNVYDCTFQSDGSNHAIELTPDNASSVDLVGCEFIDYATTDGSTGNEAIYNNSAKAITINASGNIGTISVRNGTSASTTLVIDPVTTSVTVRDITDASLLTGARVLIWVTNNANYFYQATVSITGTGTTATVSHTAHGLTTGDNVIIGGVTNDDTYNGAYTVTVTGVNAYTYTTNETISIGTATGTIVSTFAIINASTTGTGIVSDTRSLGADQPITGWVRKSTSSPYFQQGVVTGTISNTGGFSTTIQLVKDE